jgi:glycosyltransferase involved in cell wall biosynthesis
MAFSVIIPVLNALSTLPAAVESLLHQHLPPDYPAPTLWIVDNGSTDGSREWLLSRAAHLDTKGRLMVLLESKAGPAAARNAGIRAAMGQQPTEFYAFLDADCLPPPNWLDHFRRSLEQHPEWDAIGGPLRTSHFDNAIQQFIEVQGIMDVDGFFTAKNHPPMVLTANLVIRHDCLIRNGLFDETLAVGEDADWCWRLHWNGGRLGYDRQAVVERRHRSTLVGLARMMLQYGKGSIRVHRLHHRRLPPLPWDWTGGFRLMRALVKCILVPFRRLTPYQRLEAPLEVIRYGCFLFGRWRAWILG